MLSEHKGRFRMADVQFVAAHFNMLQKWFVPTELELVHEDFHCDNLLLDKRNRLCDFRRG